MRFRRGRTRKRGRPMAPRVLLTTVLIVATAAFVTGVIIERSAGEAHVEPVAAESHEGGEETSPEGAAATPEESGGETLLGIDYEAVPVIAIAAAFSLALAAAVWLRPRWTLLLALVALAMARSTAARMPR